MKKVLIVICITALLVNGYFAYFESYTSDEEEENGGGNGNGVDVPTEKQFKLKEEKSVTVGDTTHKITVLFINENAVLIRIESDPIEGILAKNHPERIDTDDDGYYDMELKVVFIDMENELVDIEIRPIHIEIGGKDDIKFSVEVPEKKLDDEYRYDFTLFAQIYWENKTSGNYSEYTLNGNGQWDNGVYGPVTAESGFGDDHQTVLERQQLDGSFTISLDSSDTGKVSVAGTFSADNKVYKELEEGRVIKSMNHGELGVDQLPKATVPIPINYVADLRYYPEPYEDQMPTLDEEIYVGENISEGDEGSFLFEGSSEWSGGYYNWTAEDVENTAGLQSLRINITSKFFNWLDFKRIVWISNDISFPTKEYLRTNQSYEDNETKFWIILEQERTLHTGYTRGNADIPWVENGNAEFPSLHPVGEYTKWDKIPEGGHMFEDEPAPKDSTVQMAPEDALQFARDNSAGLNSFLKMYPNAYVTNAKYNATLEDTDLQQKAGSHKWNFSLRDYMTDEEAREYRREKEKEAGKDNDDDDDDDEWEDDNYWPERRYSVRVAKNLTKNIIPIGTYSTTTEIDKDLGERRGWSNFRRSELASKGITLSGVVDILRDDEEAESEFFNILTGELKVEDLSIHLGEGESSADQPGFEIIQLITGITMPRSKYAWHFQRASVYESGDTFIVGVDVETGRLIYVTKVSGNQIMGLFS